MSDHVFAELQASLFILRKASRGDKGLRLASAVEKLKHTKHHQQFRPLGHGAIARAFRWKQKSEGAMAKEVPWNQVLREVCRQ